MEACSFLCCSATRSLRSFSGGLGLGCLLGGGVFVFLRGFSLAGFLVDCFGGEFGWACFVYSFG